MKYANSEPKKNRLFFNFMLANLQVCDIILIEIADRAPHGAQYKKPITIPKIIRNGIMV